MKKLKEKLASFMYGRNGVDELYKAVMASELIVMLAYVLVNLFIHNAWVNAILVIFIMSSMVYMIFRSMSKNLVKRRAENGRV